MKPRIMPLDELMVELEGEHDEICCEVNKAELIMENSDYEKGADIFKKVAELISQHTIDEQRTLLGYLIEKLGRDSSEGDIEIMRGQVKIMDLLKRIIHSINEGKTANLDDVENLRLLLKEQFSREKVLFKQASTLINAESQEDYNPDLDRYINEGGK